MIRRRQKPTDFDSGQDLRLAHSIKRDLEQNAIPKVSSTPTAFVAVPAADLDGVVVASLGELTNSEKKRQLITPKVAFHSTSPPAQEEDDMLENLLKHGYKKSPKQNMLSGKVPDDIVVTSRVYKKANQKEAQPTKQYLESLEHDANTARVSIFRPSTKYLKEAAAKQGTIPRKQISTSKNSKKKLAKDDIDDDI